MADGGLSLTAEVIDALVASGVTAEQLAAFVKASLAVAEADKQAKRDRAAAKKKRQRGEMSPNVPGTSGDIGGHRGTLRDIEGHLGTSRDIWGHRGTTRDIEGHLGTSGDIADGPSPLDPPLPPPAPPSSPPIIPPTPASRAPAGAPAGAVDRIRKLVWTLIGKSPTWIEGKLVSTDVEGAFQVRGWFDLGLSEEAVSAEISRILTAAQANGTKIGMPWKYLDAALRAEPKEGSAMNRADGGVMPEVSQWEQRVKAFADKQFWIDRWGDRPGEPGCMAPKDVLARHGFGRAA